MIAYVGYTIDIDDGRSTTIAVRKKYFNI